MATTLTPSPEQITDARDLFSREPATRAVAFWTSPDDGDTHVWGQATADNRRARVLARIAAIGGDIDPDTLVVIHRARLTASA